jgi:hypothetical protein|tara:strand:+ start:807 stop:1430 length:624 start_codon:yes stop_codon:yes gene_type:complete
MTYVYLKTGSFTGTDLNIDTIPLDITSVSVSVSKTIPAFPIPFSGVVTGESLTAALDLGMATKTISLTGFISETTLRKTRTASSGDTETSTALTFTAHEIAQMIASGVDSTGLQDNQSMNELVILYPSKVSNAYAARTETLVPFNFASRGAEGFGDNLGVSLRKSVFPDSDTDTGLTGFIRSFSFNLEAETVDIGFSMEFEVATVGP